MERLFSMVECPPMNFGCYSLGEELGRGASGSVFLCQKRGSCEKYAAKAFDLRRLQLSADIDRDMKKIQREAEILRKLPPHPNVVRFNGVVHEGEWLILLLELVTGGDLFSAMVSRPKIDGRPRFKEGEACFIFQQLVSGLAHLHSHAIIHRDLKLENVLVIEQRTNAHSELLLDVKLVDFGLSKIVGEGLSDATSTVGSPRYIAPEVLQKGVHDFRADLWSLGILMHVLVAGRYPDDAPTKLAQSELEAIVRTLPISEGMQAILIGLLQLQPSMRTSIESLQHSPWLAASVCPDNGSHRSSSSEVERTASEATTTSAASPSVKRARRALWLSGNPWQANTERASSWRKQPRSRISDARVKGEVRRWCGRYGWIQPSMPIAHAAAAKHCGDVFVHATDVENRQTLAEGMEVDFFVYLDGNGLGAEQCRPVASPMLKIFMGEDTPAGRDLVQDGLLPNIKNADALLDGFQNKADRDGMGDVDARRFHLEGEPQ
mmetsp:Transcript_85547/g.149122  ORF Transcript_85547/g.149122 Transcript_85547/m.149122 type:complete len:492 (-) Transcript_85547:15-1490(-)